ncbi:MAG: hypothetical protein GOP50_08210 [Candidatus Heimdallarchaeota archaeon]|nr:hypothetical protein [Candidatus Heimdallarchaeota archaeon]
MGYAGITFLLFVAYVPLIWIIFRIKQRNKVLGYLSSGVFALLLLGVWVVGFLNRTMMVGAIEHLILVGSINTILVLIFELTINKINIIMRLKRRKKSFVSIAVLILVIIIAGHSLLGIRKTMLSARHFESMVTYDSTDLPFIVLNEEAEIDNNIRLVTKEFAISKAEQNKATFGSNADLMEANVIYVNESIYWCMIYAPKSSAQFWTPGQFNLAWGLILVEVNNPNAEPIIVNFAEGDFNYAEGLWRNHNVILKNYRRDQGAKYWRSYPTWTGTEWVYVMTRTTRDVYGAWKSDGIDVLDIKTGGLIIHYSVDELETTPDYILQIYSEVLIEEKWIINWGNKRDTTAEGNIRLLSGFPNYSSDRLGFYGEGIEDIRYVKFMNSTLAFFATHPKDSEETLGGIGVIRKNGTRFYDLRSRGFISALTVSKLARGQLTAPNTGSYIVQMPVPYTLNTSIGFRLAWFVPIYWQSGSVQRLSHVCVIDALDSSYISIAEAEGLTGSQVVKEARLQFKSFFASEIPQQEFEIAQIDDAGTYVDGGNSIFVFQLNDSRIIRCSQNYLNETHWNEVVLANIGNVIQYTYTEDDEGILWATEFFVIS